MSKLIELTPLRQAAIMAAISTIEMNNSIGNLAGVDYLETLQDMLEEASL